MVLTWTGGVSWEIPSTPGVGGGGGGVLPYVFRVKNKKREEKKEENVNEKQINKI
jgi:hypothetical protein